MTKKFNTDASDTFANDDGDVFEFNHERTEFLSEHILEHYKANVDRLAKKYKKSKNEDKKHRHALNICALHDEWNLGDELENTETLYCVFSKNNPDVWTDLTTENEYYAS